MEKDTIDHGNEEPTDLAEEVADLLAKPSDDEEDNPPPEAKYRDIELEKEIKAEKDKDKQAELAAEVLAYEKEKEDKLIDDLRGSKRKEKTKKEVETDVKKIKKARKKGNRAKAIKKAMKYSKARERNEEAFTSVKQSRKSLLTKTRQALKKLAAYKSYAILRPGKQAGAFDKDQAKGSKRGLKHDMELGSQVVVEKFTTKIDGVTVSGTITKRVDDENPQRKLEQVGDADIKIDTAQKRGRNISPESLGNLSHDALINSISQGTIER